MGNSILWSVPSACAVLLARHGFTRSFAGRFLARFGLASYSFYLLQQPALLMTSPIAHKITTTPLGLLALGSTGCLVLVGIGAWLMYRYVEVPSIRIGARIVAAQQARTGPGQAQRPGYAGDPARPVKEPVSRGAGPGLDGEVRSIGDQTPPIQTV